MKLIKRFLGIKEIVTVFIRLLDKVQIRRYLDRGFKVSSIKGRFAALTGLALAGVAL